MLKRDGAIPSASFYLTHIDSSPVLEANGTTIGLDFLRIVVCLIELRIIFCESSVCINITCLDVNEAH